MAINPRHAEPFSPSPDPLPQPPTKRDVRRNRVMERLQTMIDSFAANQHQHYRAQLQAVQVDMTLVLRADPHQGLPLEDGAGEIQSLVEQTINGAANGMEEGARRDFESLAGSRYRDFTRGVNDWLEQRDADLVALHNNYTSAIAALHGETEKKVHQANEEYTALASTIRQRLVQSITKKRAQLLRDKDSLDIADSNALLLHPNHFSINNPGSPGGNGGQNRKTRHLRHRAVSPGAGTEGENGGLKRKRKANDLPDGGNESPAPAFRPLPPPDNLGGGRSPFKDAREKNTYTQYEAPAYSLERLFTDKELAMATETAKMATYRHFHQSQPQQQEGSGSNGTAVPSVDGQDLMDTAADDNGEGPVHPTTEAIGTPPPNHVAPEMERTASHQVLTRGGARANPLAALSDLATAAAASASAPVRDNPFAPVVPSYHAVTRSEKSGAPAPSGVSGLDVESDWEMMQMRRPAAAALTLDGAGMMGVDEADEEKSREMRRQLLDQALGNPTVTQPYRLPLLETGPAVIGRGVERLLGAGFAPSVAMPPRMTTVVGPGGSMAAALQGRIGAEPMSRTTSAGGASEVGGGGGAGLAEASAAGRRGRRLV